MLTGGGEESDCSTADFEQRLPSTDSEQDTTKQMLGFSSRGSESHNGARKEERKPLEPSFTEGAPMAANWLCG